MPEAQSECVRRYLQQVMNLAGADVIILNTCSVREKAEEKLYTRLGEIRVMGEETGRLDTMFSRMADIYESDTRAAIKRFTALFGPLVILVMGVFIGALILSMLLAITSINEVAV